MADLPTEADDATSRRLDALELRLGELSRQVAALAAGLSPAADLGAEVAALAQARAAIDLACADFDAAAARLVGRIGGAEPAAPVVSTVTAVPSATVAPVEPVVPPVPAAPVGTAEPAAVAALVGTAEPAAPTQPVAPAEPAAPAAPEPVFAGRVTVRIGRVARVDAVRRAADTLAALPGVDGFYLVGVEGGVAELELTLGDEIALLPAVRRAVGKAGLIVRHDHASVTATLGAP
jgi:hypothetical protein